jgi:hypothetical protein
MSFAAVVMFADPGSARFALCVIVKAPAKTKVMIRPSHEFVEAMDVIPVTPVTENTEAVEGGVTVEAEARVARETVCLMKA